MKNDSLVLALRRLLPCQDIEIISDVIPAINEGDVILLRKHADSLSGAYARLQDVPEIMIPGHNDEEYPADTDEAESEEDEVNTKGIDVGSDAFSACRFATNAFAITWSHVQNTPHIAVVTEADRSTRRISVMYAILPTAIRR